MQSGERDVGVARPRGCEGAREIVLLGQEVACTIGHAPRFYEHDERVVADVVGEQFVVAGQPRQPALHAVEDLGLGESLPLLATPRIGRDESRGALPHALHVHELARGENECGGDVVGAALFGDREPRQAVDLVAPQVDAHGFVVGTREDVDDRAAPRELAAVLDDGLAPVPEHDQPLTERIDVDDVADADADRVRGGRSGCELLQQRTHSRHHDLRARGRLSQAPDGSHARPHGVDGRAHAFERQRLPGREVFDRLDAEEVREVLGEFLCHGAGRHRHDDGAPFVRLQQSRDRGRARSLGHRQGGVSHARDRLESRFVRDAFAEELQGQPGGSPATVRGGFDRAGVHRPLNSCIAASIPAVTMRSMASTATSIATSSSLRSAAGIEESTWSAPCSLDRGLPTPMRTRA